MSNYRCVNFYDLCRLCTACSDEKLNIFSEEGKSKDLSSKIAECLPLVVDEKDRLPKVLCPQCVQHVENIAEFRNICKNSQSMLNSCLNTATQQQNGAKVYIKDAVAAGSGKSLSVMQGNASSNAQQNQNVNTNASATAAAQTFANQSVAPASGTQAMSLAQQSNNDFLSSIMQAVGIQSTDSSTLTSKTQPVQQYTITLDNKVGIKTEPIEYTIAASNTASSQQATEKDSKHNALEEFLRMKPNIKVTPIKKKSEQQQQQSVQQQQQVSQQQQHTLQQQQQSVQQQATTQQQQQQFQQQQQNQQHVAQLQLQQLQQQIQQQLQHQWQQQQLQQQLQQLTAQLQPQNQQQQQQHININDALSPSKTKKPKLNFVITSPTSQSLAGTLPQLNAASSSVVSQPQIQLQFQTAPATNAQQQQQATTAALLQNLAPFLQQQSSQQLQQNSTLSPNKCYLPITIKDENSDQQIVAHIDAKNFVLPTTYQLQMKLQPQIQTVDGQPIMQLTPTSIPATLQLAPQVLSNQTLQTATSTNQQLQQTLQQTNFQQQQKQLPQNVQITSQQILTSPNNLNSNNIGLNNTHDAATSTNDQLEDVAVFSNNLLDQQQQQQNVLSAIKPQTYRLLQQPGSDRIEITPTTNLTQQIMQQVNQQQKQRKLQQLQQQQKKQQEQKQQQSTTSTITTTLPTQHGGITVQRITTTKAAAAKSQQQPKLPVLNKQNVTISRIIPTQPHNQVTKKHEALNTAQQQQSTKIEQQNVLPTINQTTQQQHVTNAVSQVQQQPQQVPQQPHAAKSKTLPLKRVTRPAKPATTATTTTTTTTNNTTTNNNSTQSHITPSTATVYLDITVSDGDEVVAVRNFPSDTADTNNSTNTPNTSIVNIITEAHGTGPDGLECSQCRRVFKKKEHLTQHVKLHAGVRPFKCTEEGCNKDFSRKEHLLRHIISHTGKKMFNCDVCQKLFSRKDNLNKHKRIHSDQPNSSNYNCEICHKSFANKIYYQQHKLIHEKARSSDAASKADKNKLQQKSTHAEQAALPQQQQQQELQLQQQQQKQASQQQHQQIQIVQQQQQPQIMHLQLPAGVVTTQHLEHLANNTITITQSSDPNNPSLKAIGSHDATVLNLPTSLANFVQLGQAQFVNATTGEIMGHIKIEK